MIKEIADLVIRHLRLHSVTRKRFDVGDFMISLYFIIYYFFVDMDFFCEFFGYFGEWDGIEQQKKRSN